MGRCIDVCMLVLWVPVCVTFIVLGAVYIDDCPVKRVIPVHMIISGSFGLLYAFSSCYKDRVVCQHLSKLFWFMIIVWCIIGHNWIFSVFQPNYERKGIIGYTYCKKSLYIFAASTTIILEIFLIGRLLGLFSVCKLFMLCLVCCVSLCKSDDVKPDQVVEPLRCVETERCVGTDGSVGTEVCVGTDGSVGTQVCVETEVCVGTDGSVGTEVCVGTDGSVGTQVYVETHESVGHDESVGTKEYVVTEQSESNTAHY
ncbi:unnamed protein product, partial [Coregonus sp. 'balchen']